ncbi:hypothetical protein [Neorhodopirellula lusitana]|nr:hypothetical protein [Neorhodopirellula lusitana]
MAESAPVATATSPSIAWKEKEIIHFHYSLIANSRIANFGFSEKTATASVGGPPIRDLPHAGIKRNDPSVMEVTLFGVYWRISPTGTLLLTNPDEEYSAELRLVHLDDRFVSVWNVTRGEHEVYARTQ